MSDPDDFQAKLKALCADFATHLPGKLERIEQAWQQLPHDVWDAAGFQSFNSMVHGLSGSGKTFGFALLGAAARTLEDYLKPILRAETVPNEEQRQHIRDLLGELHQAQYQRATAPP